MKHLLISLICTSLFSFAGNEANITRSVEVVNTTPTLTSITLESNATTVNVGDTVQLTVTGTYSDGSNSAVDENITFTINLTDSAEANGSVLRAKKDGNVTVQASIDGVNSNTIALNITWVVNGHVLPPEPDKALNDSTLLGIDVNNNGVRDDVERWIYETYNEYIPCHQELDYTDMTFIEGKSLPNAIEVCEENPIPYHPIVRAVAMQGARALQIIIQEPERAKINKTYEVLDAAQDCELSIKHLKKRIYEQKEYSVITKISLKERNTLIDKFLNTTQRVGAYAKYNYFLSGGIYSVPTDEEGLTLCDGQVKKLLAELK